MIRVLINNSLDRTRFRGRSGSIGYGDTYSDFWGAHLLIFSCSFQCRCKYWHLSVDQSPTLTCQAPTFVAQLLLETHTPPPDLQWIEADYPQLLKSLDLCAIAVYRCIKSPWFFLSESTAQGVVHTQRLKQGLACRTLPRRVPSIR